MKIMIRLVLGAFAMVLAGGALAQDDEPTVFTYATYMYCKVGSEDAVDKIVAEQEVPVLDKLVADGKILSYGWLKHHTGGKWRRIRYHQADSLDALLDGLEAFGQGIDALDDEDSRQEVAKGCPSHDDYIWEVKNGSGGETRGTAGFSVYHVCDIQKEERADEIVADHFAPIFNKMVEDGKLTSWGWSSHVVGGKFRKLQTMTAADHKALLKARGEAIGLIYDEDSAAGTEFSEICGPHVDYMWDIAHENAKE